MRRLTVLLLAICSTGPMWSQEQQTMSPASTSPSAPNESANLPVEKIGDNDLLGVSVYDSPELTRTVRVGSDGDIRLPMIEQHIHASGLYPEQLEKLIAAVLSQNKVIRHPVVSVAILQYMSRPITVVGAVRTLVTFQAAGPMTLLEAISRAGGLADNAGPEIVVSRPEQGPDGKPTMLEKRIPVHDLFDGADPGANIQLDGGEVIRVPEADRIFVMGDVKKPGYFYLTDGPESSVMNALALSEGLDSHPAHVAYIYRTEGNALARAQIPVNVKGIMDRRSPDVALKANDILYVPTAGQRGLKVLEASLPIAATLGATLLYIGLQ